MGKFQISSFFAGFVDTEALQRLRGNWMQLRYLYAIKLAIAIVSKFKTKGLSPLLLGALICVLSFVATAIWGLTKDRGKR